MASPPCRVTSDRLCAELAARGCDGNQRLALDTGFFCRIRYRRFSLELSYDVVHGHHNDEVDDSCLQQERDHGVEKDAVVDLAAIDVKDERRESGLPTRDAMSGVRTFVTNDVTIAVNAAPMITATARSITLPRMMKSRKPLIISFSLIGVGS
jgi:hypothetical protein